MSDDKTEFGKIMEDQIEQHKARLNQVLLRKHGPEVTPLNASIFCLERLASLEMQMYNVIATIGALHEKVNPMPIAEPEVLTKECE